MAEVCWHQEELVCWWGWCMQASTISTDTNSFWQGWKSRKRKKKNVTGRKKERGEKKQYKGESRVRDDPCLDTDTAYSSCADSSFHVSPWESVYPCWILSTSPDWTPVILEMHMYGIGSQALGKYFCKSWCWSVSIQRHKGMGLSWLPYPTFSIVQSLNQDSSQVPFHYCSVCSLTVDK